MIIKIGKNIIHYYNKEKDIFIISHLDAQGSPVYIVEGWFAKKLHEFLEGDGNFERFLGKYDDDLKGFFKRLFGSLAEKNLLCYEGEDSLASLSKEEYSGFGVGQQTGKLSHQEFDTDNISADAHLLGSSTYSYTHSSCIKGHWHTNNIFVGGYQTYSC